MVPRKGFGACYATLNPLHRKAFSEWCWLRYHEFTTTPKTLSNSVNALITRDYNGHTFVFRDDGYFNMTRAAKHFGKDLQVFMRREDIIEYLEALALVVPHTDKPLVITQRGSGLLPGVGTWGHPKLAIRFAQWLDVKFAVWCDSVIEDILAGRADLTITKPEQSAVLQTSTPTRSVWS